MLTDYYDEYCKQFTYKPIHKRLVTGFQDYLHEQNIPPHESYQHIEPYIDTLPVLRRTRRTYRTLLRRYTEYVYNMNNWKYTEGGLTI